MRRSGWGPVGRGLLPLGRVGKPGAPRVMEGKGKERSTGSIDTHSARAALHSDNSSARGW
jgi:hypothetical protein